MEWELGFRSFFHGTGTLSKRRFRKPFPEARFRLYCETDFDRCSEIYENVDQGRFPPNGLGEFQKYLKEDVALKLVIESEGETIGTCGIDIETVKVGEYSFDNAWLIYGLIDSKWQGNGFGTLSVAFRLSLLTLERSSWLVRMTSAGNGTEKFYKQLGFRFFQTSDLGAGVSLDEFFGRITRNELANFQSKLRPDLRIQALLFGKYHRYNVVEDEQ